jgi:uncharacterized protein (TIGR02145 family)
MLLMKSLCGKKSLRGFVAAAAVSGLLLLAACDEDSGTSVPNDNGTSDSEEIQSSSSSEKRSSSSQKSSSSSSLKKVSSSSKLTSSSSSSEKAKSSSSSKGEAKSSSSNQSSSSSGKNGDGWSWDVPKEARLNPEIAYDSITDPRDGQIYKTVKIGNQVWMAENLNYADSTKTPSLMGKSCCYGNKAENCAVAGRLYTWAAAIDSVKLIKDKHIKCGDGRTCSLPDTVYGICPPGWHLPTNKEWKTLFSEVGGSSTAGMVLKSRTGWYGSGGGTDAYGFSALPAGSRLAYGHIYYDPYFSGGGNDAGFWSVTEYSYSYAYHLYLDYEYEETHLIYLNKLNAISVRCLKN